MDTNLSSSETPTNDQSSNEMFMCMSTQSEDYLSRNVVPTRSRVTANKNHGECSTGRVFELVDETLSNLINDINDIKTLDEENDDDNTQDKPQEQELNDNTEDNEVYNSSDEEPVHKKIKLSHTSSTTSDESKDEIIIMKDKDNLCIKDLQFKDYIDNLYRYLYFDSCKSNNNEINDEYLTDDNKFLNKLVIDGEDLEFNIDNYKSCYMLTKVKRKVLPEFSFTFYLSIINASVLLVALESIFAGMIFRSSLLLFSIISFMSFHLFINQFKYAPPKSLFNRFYEFHAYYTDYNSGYIRYKFHPHNHDEYVNLELTGNYRITCSKSFFIEGFIHSKNNTDIHKRVTMLLNKPYKYGGIQSLILRDDFSLNNVLIKRNKSRNIDVLLSSKNDIINKLLITDVFTTDEHKDDYSDYSDYIFDIYNSEENTNQLPLFFRIATK